MASMEPGAPRLPEEEMAGLRADVLAQIEELSTLVGDLVDLTREDAGGIIHETVELAEVIDRSLERVRRRRNDIEFDIALMPWQVYGDGAGLARAVLNLLDNAAKWSPPGGRVSVRLTQMDALHAELVVSDYGPGIPPQERRLVFERFFRSTAARAMPGSGLGLAIVKQVVLKHGGTLRVGNRSGWTRRVRQFTWCCPVDPLSRRQPSDTRSRGDSPVSSVDNGSGKKPGGRVCVSLRNVL